MEYIAIDQYNQTFKIHKHPRKELCEQLDNSHVDKIYVDTKDGKSKHVGYIIAGLWLRVYKLSEFKA